MMVDGENAQHLSTFHIFQLLFQSRYSVDYTILPHVLLSSNKTPSDVAVLTQCWAMPLPPEIPGRVEVVGLPFQVGDCSEKALRKMALGRNPAPWMVETC